MPAGEASPAPAAGTERTGLVAGAALAVALWTQPLARDAQFPRAPLWLCLVVFGAAVVFAVRRAGAGRPLSLPMGLVAPFGLFWFCVLISLLASIQQMHSVDAVLDLLAWSLIFIMAAHLGRVPGWRRWTVRGIVAVSVLLALLAVLQRAYLFDLLRGRPAAAALEPLRLQSNRVFATFLSPGVYGAYLALLLPWQLGVFDARRPAARRGAAGARRLQLAGCVLLIGLQLAALFLTRSRAAWLATALSLTAYAFITRPSRMRWLFLAPVIPAVLLALALRPEWAATNTLLARLSYWRGSVEMLRLRPWTGVGLGAWGDAYPTTFTNGSAVTQVAHNDWLQRAAETGIVGGAAFACFVLVVLSLGARALRDAQTDTALRGAAGLWCGVFGVCIAASFEYPLARPAVAWLIAAAMGLLVAHGWRLPDAAAVSGPSRWVFAGALAVVVSAASVVAVRHQLARDAWAAATAAAARQDVAGAEAACKRMLAFAPLDPDAYGLLGVIYLRRGMVDVDAAALSVAAPYTAAASSRAPWNPWQADRAGIAHWRLAEARGDPQRKIEALGYFRRAVAHFPTHPGFRNRLAGVLGQLGHPDAREALAAAVDAQLAWRETPDIAGPSPLGEDLDLW